MPFQPAPEIVQVEMRFTQEGQKLENVYHVARDDSDSPAARLAVAAFFYDWWVAEMQPLVAAEVTLREIFCTDLSTEAGGTSTFVPTTTTGGANVNGPMPLNVTLAVSARTSKSGRSYRGRSYFVGLTRNVVAGSLVTGAAVAAIQAAYNALQSTYIEQGQLVVLSRRHAGDLRPVALGEPITTWVVVDNAVDSQRRRLLGRGE